MTDLLTWSRDAANEPDEKFLYKGAFWQQVMFVRDVLPTAFPDGLRTTEDHRTCRTSPIFVVSTHTSKSIKLPTYTWTYKGVGFFLRGNFHDWNLSVTAPHIVGQWAREFDNAHGYCFFQGFPEEWKFPRFADNPRRFSVCIADDYPLYAFLWTLAREFK